jgi:hypothetical protein
LMRYHELALAERHFRKSVDGGDDVAASDQCRTASARRQWGLMAPLDNPISEET